MGEVGWHLFLASLPFAPLLERRLDLWHGQAMWAVLWVSLLTCLALAQGIKAKHLPLAWWWACTFFLVWWEFTKGIIGAKQYNALLLMPLVHILAIGCFVLTACSQWTRQTVQRLSTTLAVLALVLTAYGWCQAMNLDPIFRNLEGATQKDIVGMIGNPTHFGAHLALLLPFVWVQSGKVWWGLRAASISLIGMILLRNASLGGVLCLWAMGVAYLFWHCGWRWKAAGSLFLLSPLTMGWGVAAHPHLFSDSGRLTVWPLFAQLLHQHPWTGIGPGAIAFLSQTITSGPLQQWRHVHNEWLQLTIEQGVIGLVIVLWALLRTMRQAWTYRTDPLVQMCAMVLLAFVVNSLINFPAHLWVLGSLGLVAYCGITVLAGEM